MASRPAPSPKSVAKTAAVAKKPTVAPAIRARPSAAVVTLKAVFEQLGATHALPKKQAHEMLADFVAAVTRHLQQGDRLRLGGLGTLEVKARAARTGRNPATGATIQIKASKKVAFRAAKELKEAI